MSDSDATREHDEEQATGAEPIHPSSEAAKDDSQETRADEKADAASVEPDDTADASPESANDASDSSGLTNGRAVAQKDDEKRDKWSWHSVVGIVAVLCIELYICGNNGKIEVCVGM